MEKVQNKKKQKRMLLLIGMVLGITLYGWSYWCEKDAHADPAVQRVLLEVPAEGEEWTEEALRLAESQTGLGIAGILQLEREGRLAELPLLQEAYFSPVQVRCVPNSILTKEEYLVNERGEAVSGMPIAVVEDGDILITCCSHALGWRNGHAAIVTDASKRQVLEAQVLGSPTVYASVDRWECYPAFLVLRLKGVSKEERARAAEVAKREMAGLPYRLSAGLWNQKELNGTQCAHLVWYAYRQIGYDLDGDGGRIVTPADLAKSELLEVVQRYGM